jgi:rhodanese-related sulfurtransferase
MMLQRMKISLDKICRVILTSLFVATVCVVANAQSATDLPPKEFQALISKNSNAVIVDVRTLDELKSEGMIKGAIHIDYLAKDFEKKASSLDKTKTYLFYCASGFRSDDAKQFLVGKGFKNIFNLKGGLAAWKKAKFETVPYPGS